MAKVAKIEVQIKSPEDKFYGIVRHNITHFAEVLPDQFESIEQVEGDGQVVGSVRLWKFVLGEAKFSSHYLFHKQLYGTPVVAKDRISAIDDDNKSITCCVFEGDINKYYCTFNITIQVTTESDGTLVKWFLEFEKANKEVPHPTLYLDLFDKVTMKMDDYLLKA
ncbi:hypothetical protein HHK36_006775 [Tetracentron sinense]|uniref:Bet v I/Major latex protein domain-containing protein n=1 Tax=Tetracentron sinense TaxID=13715 RepID=A0A835DPI9_TETSI|nr:hypothetical protein HHK36_006775 [Tetracentron sinense]